MTAGLTGVCISMERLLFRIIIQSYYSGELFLYLSAIMELIFSPNYETERDKET